MMTFDEKSELHQPKNSIMMTKSSNKSNHASTITTESTPSLDMHRHQDAPPATDSKIVNFYNNRSVLITGGSGFIGKVLIEKLLRTCSGIRQIFVLIRPKKNLGAKERMIEEIIKSPLFDSIRGSTNLESKIIALEGDITQLNFGLNDENLTRVINEVSVIFHSAATVRFDDPIKQAVSINLVGVKNMINLSRQLRRLAAVVHVSTAYANCDKPTVDEHVYPVDIDPDKLISIADWLDQDTLHQIEYRFLGKKPNTYTYTKSLAEYFLVKTARDLPIVICRPSIVCASWREPFSGWIDNFNGPTGIILGAAKGIIRTMYAQSSYVADLVPVDYVTNQVITLGWFANEYKYYKGTSPFQIPSSAEIVAKMDGSVNTMEFSSTLSTSDSTDEQSNCDNSMSIDCNSMIFHKISDAETLDQLINIQAMEKRNTDCKNLSLVDEGYGSSSNSSFGSTPFSTTMSLHQSSSSASSSLANDESPPATNIDDEVDYDSDDITLSTSHQRQKQRLSSDCNILFNQKQHELATDDDDAQIDREIIEHSHAASGLENKFKHIRKEIESRLAAKDLPAEYADVPVFHCASGAMNPITWGHIQYFVLSLCTIFPCSQMLRYPGGSFTNKKYWDRLMRIFLHYIPAYIVDMITYLVGRKPILMRIYRKFDKAAEVLQAFTMRQWRFETHNSMLLREEFMSEEENRLFNFDMDQLDWASYMECYVLGVRQFMLKESIDDLQAARKNLNIVYYRNLAMQLLCSALVVYYVARRFITP